MASAVLSASNVAVGLVAHSTSVFAVGLEFAGDVLASAVVLVGLRLAARPPDENHPYGHGRLETLAGLLVGFLLMAGGAAIGVRSVQAVHGPVSSPHVAAAWVLVIVIVVRTAMSLWKFRVGRRVGSTSLVADAWNDAVDILSAGMALAAVSLARFDPARFQMADHYGGVFVGAVVIVTGARVVRDASLALADTMPEPSMTAGVLRVAMSVPGVMGIEQQRVRKTGLQYHVDLHLEVDPEMTVRESHEIAHEVKRAVREALPWVADVLVHVEPAPEVRRARTAR